MADSTDDVNEGLPTCPNTDRVLPGHTAAIAQEVANFVADVFALLDARGIRGGEGELVARPVRAACRYCFVRGVDHRVSVVQVDTPFGRFLAQRADRINFAGAPRPDPIPSPVTAPGRVAR
jgi:hypothetical protein